MGMSGHDSRFTQAFALSILGLNVRIRCSSPALSKVIPPNFGAMAAAENRLPPDLDYSISGSEDSISLVRNGETFCSATDPADLLFRLEKDITVELQRKRSDHLFLHSAALAWKGKACLLAADSGSGKSLTTWALLHHGFEYLSDELSPIDLESLRVAPYPHALCLKQPPPASYPLPQLATHLGRTIHVPANLLPGTIVTEPLPVGAVFLLRYRPDLPAPQLRPLGPAESAARLYLTALNALSHPHRGLDAVLRIAEHIPVFAVASGNLPTTCDLIRSAMEQVIDPTNALRRTAWPCPITVGDPRGN